MCPARPASFMPSTEVMSKAVAITLPYFEVQVSLPETASSRATPRGCFHRLVIRSLWKSMFLPTRTAPPASGHMTLVHMRASLVSAHIAVRRTHGPDPVEQLTAIVSWYDV